MQTYSDSWQNLVTSNLMQNMLPGMHCYCYYIQFCQHQQVNPTNPATANISAQLLPQHLASYLALEISHLIKSYSQGLPPPILQYTTESKCTADVLSCQLSYPSTLIVQKKPVYTKYTHSKRGGQRLSPKFQIIFPWKLKPDQLELTS